VARYLVWGAQILLALAYLFSGVLKTTQPVEVLVANGITWTADVPLLFVRFIGVVGLLGALGLILPAVTGIRRGLVPLAAAGLALVQMLAVPFHLARGEAWALPLNLVLLALALLVVVARRAPARERELAA
jgi:putative oxidoreductase